MTSPSATVAADLTFRAAQAITQGVEVCYTPEFTRAIAVAYESGPESATEAMSVERRIKAHFKVELNLAHFRALVKQFRATLRLEVPRPESSLPEIMVSSRQLREVTAESISALEKANSPPCLFVRSGALVHVEVDEAERPSVAPASESYLRGALARAADYKKTNQYGEIKDAFPLIDVVRDIMALNPGVWPFPRLSSVVEVPTLRADGTIVDQPGYDASSSSYYAPASGLERFPLPEAPTQADTREALDTIEEAIGEFPYADEASKANVIGLLLTPVLRPAINGSTPLAVVDAPQAGTGKSLLIDVLSIITTGRPAAMVPYPYKEEEMVKQIGASLMSGRQLIAFDNLEGELRSPALALALTAKEYEARILGYSKNMTVPNVSTWIVTGNNIRPAGDMPRRCYQIRLNAKHSKPYNSRDFKHPELLEWVKANRSKLLHALLTIARYWYASGCPSGVEGAAIGSFEDWHRKIAGILKRVHVNGFLANYAAFIEQEDESPRQWEGFLAYIYAEWRSMGEPASRYFSIADLMERIPQQAALKEVLPAEIADSLERKLNHRIVVGKMFRTRRERRFGYGEYQYWLEREVEEESGAHKGAAMWRVRRATEEA